MFFRGRIVVVRALVCRSGVRDFLLGIGYTDEIQLVFLEVSGYSRGIPQRVLVIFCQSSYRSFTLSPNHRQRR
jgi:hypothetical protein